MKKIIIASLALALAGCGPSEEEIQARIDKELAQKVETLRAEMKAERAAEKAAELEAAAAAEGKRKAEEKAAEDARLAKAKDEQQAKENREKEQEVKNKLAAVKRRIALLEKIKEIDEKCRQIFCQTSFADNFFTVTVRDDLESQFAEDIGKYIIEPFSLPPSVVSHIASTSANAGIQYDKIPGAKLSWVMGIGDMQIYGYEKILTFNIELL